MKKTKKIVLLFTLLGVCFVNTNAQSISDLVHSVSAGLNYEGVKSYITSLGYTISSSDDLYSSLKVGEYYTRDRTFYAENSYVIVAMSDDRDVTDVDLTLYYPSYNKWKEDTSVNRIAVIEFSPSYRWDNCHIRYKNYASSTPTYASRVYMFVAYK
jgi:hypothetical protein